jgi:hypothetical protein
MNIDHANSMWPLKNQLYTHERENSEEGRMWNSLTEKQKEEVLQAYDDSLIEDEYAWKGLKWRLIWTKKARNRFADILDYIEKSLRILLDNNLGQRQKKFTKDLTLNLSQSDGWMSSVGQEGAGTVYKPGNIL